MSYLVHADNIKKAIKELRDTRLEETGKIMHDDLALVASRVINRGLLSDGSSTGTYSDAKVPYWFHGSGEYMKKNAAFDIKKKQKESLKKDGYFSSYKQWRAINNRPTAFKTFSFTGNMWKKIRALMIENSQEVTSYVIGSDDPEVEKVIAFNTAQSGDFLMQSDEERSLLTKLNRQRVFKILEKYNLV